MLRISASVLAFGVALAALPGPVNAAAADDALAIVTGVAPGDLLNVRAAASPVGRTMSRLPNGAAVKNFGCGEFNGYQWCKVEVVDQPDIAGWVPARYLLGIDLEGTATAALPTLDDQDIKAEAANASARTAHEEGDAGGGASASAPLAVPPDLAARFGDAPRADASEAGQDQAAPAGLTVAETDAYRLAFAARAEAAASARQDATGAAVAPEADAMQAPDVMSSGTSEPAIGDEGDTAQSRETGETTGAPVPTPRPDWKAEAASADATEIGTASASGATAVNEPSDAAKTPAPQIVALADLQTSPAWDATGEIPCARYVGQPMTRCHVGVKRSGDGKAEVTVTWPDGGARVINFYGGEPAGANSRGEFRFTREGALNMIRLGPAERFEITDALAFGD